jgi:hypothetical protein
VLLHATYLWVNTYTAVFAAGNGKYTPETIVILASWGRAVHGNCSTAPWLSAHIVIVVHGLDGFFLVSVKGGSPTVVHMSRSVCFRFVCSVHNKSFVLFTASLPLWQLPVVRCSLNSTMRRSAALVAIGSAAALARQIGGRGMLRLQVC